MRIFNSKRTDVAPSRSLISFPIFELRRGSVLYRMHLRGTSPWSFASSPGMRLNLPSPRGTCYFGRDITAAVHFAVARTAGGYRLVMEEHADQFVISRVTMSHNYRLANLTSAQAARFNATVDLIGVDEARVWAESLSSSGFGGALYFSPYATEQERRRKDELGPLVGGVALFGRPITEPAPHFEITEMTGREAIEAAGYRIMTTPTKNLVTII